MSMFYGKIMIQTRIHLTKNNFLSKSVMFNFYVLFFIWVHLLFDLSP